MRIHRRERLVNEAVSKVREALLTACKDLTEGEALRVAITVLGDWVGTTAKYMIREERHGKTDKPGGLE